MNASSSKKEIQETLTKNVFPCIMKAVLTNIMRVEVPIGADTEWVAERLSEEIITKGPIVPGS